MIIHIVSTGKKNVFFPRLRAPCPSRRSLSSARRVVSLALSNAS